MMSEGVLAGLVWCAVHPGWSFEGREYETAATEAQVSETVVEALAEPGRTEVQAAREFVFAGKTGFQYTSQALLAMLVAYEQECEGGDGVEPVVAILREAARRIAVIEALTV